MLTAKVNTIEIFLMINFRTISILILKTSYTKNSTKRVTALHFHISFKYLTEIRRALLVAPVQSVVMCYFS